MVDVLRRQILRGSDSRGGNEQKKGIWKEKGEIVEKEE